jgi:N-acetylneuraminic acid mutarotase
MAHHRHRPWLASRRRISAIAATVLIAAAGAAVTAVAAPTLAAAAGAWTPTGSMGTLRIYATPPVVLPNGKVLVAGGSGPSDPATGNVPIYNTAELYDPATGTWSPTGSLNTAREGATAVLLDSGKVLIAGGVVAWNSQTGLKGFANISEIYDPATGTFTNSGYMTKGRDSAKGVLLSDGTVLVAGGLETSPGPTSSAETYDPATGLWQETGRMQMTRQGSATLTALPNGSAISVGGFYYGLGGGTTITEVYNPTTRSWSTTGSLSSARWSHWAVGLPNGKVVVAGGAYGTGTTGCCFSVPNSETYDPATATWRLSTTGSSVISAAAVALADGRILDTGGSPATNQPNRQTSVIYDPVADTWSGTAPMNVARQQHSAVRLNDGRVLVVGGLTASGWVQSAEVYTPDGTPASPGVALGSAGMNFVHRVDEPAAHQSLTVTNIGGATLSVSGASTGTTAFGAGVGNCGSVAPGASCQLDVWYAGGGPAGTADHDTLSIASNAPGSPNTITLDGYTKGSAPTITAIVPSSGPTTGGTAITVTGTNLTGGRVAFGATEVATTCTATSCTATSPSNPAAGDVVVHVLFGNPQTVQGDVSNGLPFTYVAPPPPPAPVVTAIAPTSGPAAGGTVVTVTGTNLSGGTVAFGSAAGTNVTCGATSCTATAPAGTGTVDVRVTTAGGTTAAVSADQYTYQAPPPPAGNLVPNPGFESAGTPADYWGGKVARSNVAALSGSWSLAQTTTATSGGWDLDANSTWYAPVTAGKTYTATVWVRATKATKVSLNVDLLTSARKLATTAAGPKVTLVAGTWTKLTLTVKPGSGQVFAAFEPNFSGNTSGTVIYWDDMSLIAG